MFKNGIKVISIITLILIQSQVLASDPINLYCNHLMGNQGNRCWRDNGSCLVDTYLSDCQLNCETPEGESAGTINCMLEPF